MLAATSDGRGGLGRRPPARRGLRGCGHFLGPRDTTGQKGDTTHLPGFFFSFVMLCFSKDGRRRQSAPVSSELREQASHVGSLGSRPPSEGGWEAPESVF